MLVYVLNRNGKPLMPCKPAKARILLKQGKAKVIKRTPFTIQLLYGSSGYKQPITLGINSGYRHVGLSAVSEKQELFSAEVLLRKDMVKLLSERKAYRRSRRNRKTRYREARFINRVGTKNKGWLTPSVQHKLDSHVKTVQTISGVLQISKIIIEVANFDIQKIKKPNIRDKEYQQGEQLGFNNVREYVLYRDNHKCQHCKGRSKDQILSVHHIVSRQTGGNRPENLITLCKTCHQDYHLGLIKLKTQPTKGYKAEAFMTMVRWKIVKSLREVNKDISVTYGYVTKFIRHSLGLEKSHINDAFVIANGKNQIRCKVKYLIKQVRKQNRKLFRGIRSHINNTVPRFLFGFQRYDKVRFEDQECFIFGRRSSGYFDIRKLDGTKIHSSVKCSKLKLLESFGTLLWAPIHPPAKAGGLLGKKE